MKKAFTILILVVIFLLPACNSGVSSNASENEELSHFGTQMIYSESEYKKLLETANNLPEDMVKWEDISFIGQWRSFRLTDGYSANQGEASWYEYYMKDARHCDIVLEIDHKPDRSEANQYTVGSVPPTMKSMRSLPDAKEPTIIKRGELEYRYDKFGDLNSICWYHNGIKFNLWGNLLEYPERSAEITLVSRLLSLEDAEVNQAFAELKQSLTK